MSRFTAAATAIIAGGVLALGTALPSSAADSYYVDTDLGAEGATYPNGWFVGDPAPAVAPDTVDEGLLITGRAQVMYGGVISGADLTALVDSASVDATGPWTFQIPIFLDNANRTGYSTLRPAVANDVSTTSDWISSWALPGIPANTPVPFADIVAAFDAGVDPAVLAYGVFVAPGETATLASVTWNGDTSYFTAAPAQQPQPAAPADAVPAEADFTG